MAESAARNPVFDLSGGWLCLDFSNTLSRRPGPRPWEHLNSYRDLLAWGRQAGILTPPEVRRLEREAEQDPSAAVAALERGIAFREVIYRIFSAIAGKRPPQSSDMATFNGELPRALGHARVVRAGDGFAWDWADGAEQLDRVLWSVVRSAADLLTSGHLAKIRECAEPGCGWLFLDMSRAQRRRWCDMKVCGNRAKARRHYERTKSAGEGPPVVSPVETRLS